MLLCVDFSYLCRFLTPLCVDFSYCMCPVQCFLDSEDTVVNIIYSDLPGSCLWASEKGNQIMTNTELWTEIIVIKAEYKELYK